MADGELSFVPVIKVGKIGIIGKGRKHLNLTADSALNLRSLSWSFRNNSLVILEAARPLLRTDTAHTLFAEDERLTFNVMKCRVPTVLAPYQSPDPYTDEHHIILTFDDLMALYMLL